MTFQTETIELIAKKECKKHFATLLFHFAILMVCLFLVFFDNKVNPELHSRTGIGPIYRGSWWCNLATFIWVIFLITTVLLLVTYIIKLCFFKLPKIVLCLSIFFRLLAIVSLCILTFTLYTNPSYPNIPQYFANKYFPIMYSYTEDTSNEITYYWSNDLYYENYYSNPSGIIEIISLSEVNYHDVFLNENAVQIAPIEAQKNLGDYNRNRYFFLLFYFLPLEIIVLIILYISIQLFHYRKRFSHKNKTA